MVVDRGRWWCAVAEVVLFWGFVRRVDEGKARRGKVGEGEGEEVVRRWEVGAGGVREVKGFGEEGGGNGQKQEAPGVGMQ